MQREENTGTQDLLTYNEEKANHYTAICLLISAGMATLMWLLNLTGFFIVNKTMMNLVMPLGIILLVTPYFWMKCQKHSGKRLKYLMIFCFLLGIGVLSTVLTMHLVLAWACPVILSCHYYSPRFTTLTFIGTLLFMLITFYAGLYFGEWDSNVMHSNTVFYGAAERAAYIKNMIAGGDHILYRAFSFYYLPRAVIVFVVYLLSITLSRRTHGLLVRQNEITQEKQRLDTELTVARQIQTALLPCLFPAFPGRAEFDIYATMSPAKEVGGDFYDFFMLDDHRLAVVMADVSGKGVPAALFMVIAKTLLKDHTYADADLGDVFTEVNQLLCESNSEGLFVTAFEGVLDLQTGIFRFVNAGHEAPYIRRAGGCFQQYKIHPGFVLAGMEQTPYQQGSLQLSDGDALFLYTDGVTEATDIRNELYGRARLGRILAQSGDLPPDELLRTVRADIDAFAGDVPPFDDITMLCLQYKGTPCNPQEID